MLTIRIADGEKIEATPEHPFWVQGKGFVAAKRLARSDLLVNAFGHEAKVVSVTSRKGNSTVYNFEVANTHTYYAGKASWWVHNSCTTDALEFFNSRGGVGELWQAKWEMSWHGQNFNWHDVYREGDIIFDRVHPNGPGGVHINDYIKWFQQNVGVWHNHLFNKLPMEQAQEAVLMEKIAAFMRGRTP